MKYPIGIQSFEKLREEGYVYVDKTDLIYSLTHEGCVYFLDDHVVSEKAFLSPH